MGLRRLEVEEEFQAPPEKFYNMWKKTPHEMPNITPTNLQDAKHNAGDWNTFGHGSIKEKLDSSSTGLSLMMKTLKVTHNGIDGDMYERFKSYTCIFQFTPKGTGTFAKLTVEYEKLKDEDLISHLNMVLEFHKDAEKHFAKA
ncbi:MLP-like protein 34 [Rutidosis leptorrhynchoides]|uniref:MLP-like protein 34 n=1 Tax=Rutidosis leptorrhynchoides TaxID=125765 RepID=UPI003A9A525A